MKYLVTGGLGFIGSNLVDALVDQNHQVIVIDDLSTGSKEYSNPKVEMYHIDSICNFETVLKITKGIDCIFHLAAWARLMRSIDDPIGTNNANSVGTLTLLEAARQNHVPRFIFSSSSSVYGFQKEAQMIELMNPNPQHPYALQKLNGEQYCQMYTNLFGLKTICLRYFNVYGPRQVTKGDYALVIGKFMRQKAEQGKMTVYGDGTQTRAYTHVSDVVRANILASQLYEIPNNHTVINIGTDKETSVNEIVSLLGGNAEYINPNPRGNFEEKRKMANYNRAFSLLGWEPRISIEEGIKQLLENETNNSNHNNQS